MGYTQWQWHAMLQSIQINFVLCKQIDTTEMFLYSQHREIVFSMYDTYHSNIDLIQFG